MYVRGNGNGALNDWLPPYNGAAGYFGAGYPTATWAAVMQHDLAGTQVEQFPPPAYVTGQPPEPGHSPAPPTPSAPPTSAAPPSSSAPTTSAPPSSSPTATHPTHPTHPTQSTSPTGLPSCWPPGHCQTSPTESPTLTPSGTPSGSPSATARLMAMREPWW
jgi:hypothetical protein